jgi:hypothetical protein
MFEKDRAAYKQHSAGPAVSPRGVSSRRQGDSTADDEGTISRRDSVRTGNVEGFYCSQVRQRGAQRCASDHGRVKLDRKGSSGLLNAVWLRYCV